MIINTPCRKCMVTNVSLVISPLCTYIGKVSEKAVLCIDLWTEFGLSFGPMWHFMCCLGQCSFFLLCMQYNMHVAIIVTTTISDHDNKFSSRFALCFEICAVFIPRDIP